MTNEEIVRRYTEASMRYDFDTMDELRHPDWSTYWPQSGELVRGSSNATIGGWSRAIPAAGPGWSRSG